MIQRNPFNTYRIVLAGLLFIFLAVTVQAAEKNSRAEGRAVMTEAELQAQVMAFADRFTSIISAGLQEYKAQAPSPESYKPVFTLVAYSMSSAFTIAAESKPVGALLDMIAMVMQIHKIVIIQAHVT